MLQFPLQQHFYGFLFNEKMNVQDRSGWEKILQMEDRQKWITIETRKSMDLISKKNCSCIVS